MSKAKCKVDYVQIPGSGIWKTLKNLDGDVLELLMNVFEEYDEDELKGVLQNFFILEDLIRQEPCELPTFNLVDACERIRREAFDLAGEDFWNTQFAAPGSSSRFKHIEETDHILEFKGTLDVNKGEGIGEIIRKNSAVDHPSHYGGKDNVYETIKVIHAWGLGFDLGNAVKYISRAGKKDPKKLIEDLEKAIFYINDEIKRLKKEESFAKAE